MPDGDRKRQITEGITKAISDWGNLMGERNKLMGQVLSNDIKRRQNMFYKLQERRQQEQRVRTQIGQQQQPGGPLGGLTQPGLRVGEQGYLRPHYPSQDMMTYGYLKRKKELRPGKFDKMDEERLSGLERKIYGVAGGPWGRSGLTHGKRSTILGNLKARWYRHPMLNRKMPLKTKEQAVDYAQQEGYINYQDDPDIMTVINELPSEAETKIRGEEERRFRFPWQKSPEEKAEGVWWR